MITGVHATCRVVGTAYYAEARVEYQPDRAARVEPACRVLILLLTAELRRLVLYPRPEGSGLRPHRN